MAEVTILRTRQEIEDDEPVLPSNPVMIGNPVAFAPAPEPVFNNPSVTIAERPEHSGEGHDTVNSDANVQFAPAGDPITSQSSVVYARKPPEFSSDDPNPSIGNQDVQIVPGASPISNSQESSIFGSNSPRTPQVINSGGGDVQFLSSVRTIESHSDCILAASGNTSKIPGQEDVSFSGKSAINVGGTEVRTTASGDQTRQVNQDSVSFGGQGSLNVGGTDVQQMGNRAQAKRVNQEDVSFGGQGSLSVGSVEVNESSHGAMDVTSGDVQMAPSGGHLSSAETRITGGGGGVVNVDNDTRIIATDSRPQAPAANRDYAGRDISKLPKEREPNTLWEKISGRRD